MSVEQYEFNTNFMKSDYIVIKKAVPEEICRLSAIQYEIQQECCKIFFPNISMADLSPNSFARYSPLCFEALSVYLLPLLEEHVGEKLFPVYSYARIYYRGSRLDPHIDRQSSEISVSVCIEKDAIDWPLYIRTPELKTYEINLDCGDIVIYKGNEQEHWRTVFEGEKQIQCFLQYVKAEGDKAWLKWDTRPCLGLPFEYAGPEVKEEMAQVYSKDKLQGNL